MDTTLHLTLVVKGDEREARRVMALHMNEWFHQDVGPAPYPMGSLLHWGYDSGTWRDEEAEKDRVLAEARDLRIPVGPAAVLETANRIDSMIRGNGTIRTREEDEIEDEIARKEAMVENPPREGDRYAH